jgi:hypothetical protein
VLRDIRNETSAIAGARHGAHQQGRETLTV